MARSLRIAARMQSPFDLLAKGILDAALDPACAVSVQHMVSTEPLYVDALVIPSIDAPVLLRDRGLLGRMAILACVVEVFSSTPSPTEVHACMARVSLLRARRTADPLALWTICLGEPWGALRGWSARPMHGWPVGFYEGAAPEGPRFVVLSALPRARETLLLRLMGRDQLLRDALADLDALPIDAWERSFVPDLLLLVREDLRRMGVDRDTRETTVMKMAELKEEARKLKEAWRAEAIAEGLAEGRAVGRAEGRAEGRVEALRDAVSAMCDVLAIPLDDARRGQIAAAGADELARMMDTLRQTRALP